MPKRRRVEEQRREVEAWRASGLTAAAFAARRGFSPKSLFRWAETTDALAVSKPAEFVRLEIAPRTVPTGLVVEVGAARVRVGRGFDADLLREVVAALASGAR